MLNNAQAAATIAVKDLDAGKKFYTETLGLPVAIDSSPGAIFLGAGNGSMVLIYPRPNHEPSAATIATFQVDDVEGAVASLSARGVKFENYDMGEIKTVNHVASLPDGVKAAWFTDPDGNIISIGSM